MLKNHPAPTLLLKASGKEKFLLVCIIATLVLSVIFALLPPLLLERLINEIAAGSYPSITLALGYFGLLVLSGGAESLREILLTVFGQKIIHEMRSQMCQKLSRLSVSTLSTMDSGSIASRFVSDVDTLENLFTSGIISMIADSFTIISIFVVLFYKNTGLALMLLGILPLIYLFTRAVQKRMLSAQIENRRAVAETESFVPETIRCIRMIHVLKKEGYMRKKYNQRIQKCYYAVEKTNLYDAFYSPVILIVNAIVVAFVMILSASPEPALRSFFSMSVGTSVAVISYISKIFAPIESIGMEIQTIQSAIAGVKRIDSFLSLPERWKTDDGAGERALENAKAASVDGVCVELNNVTFSYDGAHPVFKNKNFSVKTGENVTLIGRTGAGKSTIFRLILGQYMADSGNVLVYKENAAILPDWCKRRLFGYVEQHFYMVPGTVRDQITLFDKSISDESVKESVRLVGLDDTIMGFERTYDTKCTPSLFSQGQLQLLAIARAVVSDPAILLLDEITANLDASTGKKVLEALKRVAFNRSVISISHRLVDGNAISV